MNGSSYGACILSGILFIVVVPSFGQASLPPGVTLGAAEVNALILDIKGDSNTHDPTIIKAGGLYYRFSTGRGIPVSVSKDLTAWSSAGSVFSRNPGWLSDAVPGVGDLWAPDIVLVNGEYRLYYSASTFGSNRSVIGLATAPTLDQKSPGYLWKDRGTVVASVPSDDFNAIDPNVSRDDAGGLWLAYGSFWSGITLRRLDPSTGKPPAGDDRAYPLANRGSPPDAVEGAFILPKGGKYYLFVSFDFCCRGIRSTYRIAVGRATGITGPYLDREGRSLLEGGGTILLEGGERFKGPGHNSVLSDGDSYYLVYHAYDARYGGLSKLRIEKLIWDDNGWPWAPSSLVPH